MATSRSLVNVSVSHGTLRYVDLIPAWMDALGQIDPERVARLRDQNQDIFDVLENNAPDTFGIVHDMADFTNETLFDALNEVAPDGCYFGAHDGDGSDFGFWEV